MRKFIQIVAAIKLTAAFAFAGQMGLVTVASMFLGRDSIPIGYIWQMIFISLIYGSLQLIAFSENLFKQMKTLGRMAFLGISMLAALALFAVAFQWFPAQNLRCWLIFIGLYAAVAMIAPFAFRFVFWLGGMRYDEMLTAYKSRHGNSAKE